MREPSYYRETETRALIENFVRWGGDGVAIRCGMSTLGVLRAEMTRPLGPVIPITGIEGGRTQAALERMDQRQAFALVLYHGTDLLGETIAARLGVSRRTVYYTLEAAHVAFWTALDAVALAARQEAASVDKVRQYLESTAPARTGSLEPPSAALPPLGRARRKRKTP